MVESGGLRPDGLRFTAAATSVTAGSSVDASVTTLAVEGDQVVQVATALAEVTGCGLLLVAPTHDATGNLPRPIAAPRPVASEQRLRVVAGAGDALRHCRAGSRERSGPRVRRGRGWLGEGRCRFLRELPHWAASWCPPIEGPTRRAGTAFLGLMKARRQPVGWRKK